MHRRSFRQKKSTMWSVINVIVETNESADFKARIKGREARGQSWGKSPEEALPLLLLSKAAAPATKAHDQWRREHTRKLHTKACTRWNVNS
jgi:hypothetical protein